MIDHIAIPMSNFQQIYRGNVIQANISSLDKRYDKFNNTTQTQKENQHDVITEKTEDNLKTTEDNLHENYTGEAGHRL